VLRRIFGPKRDEVTGDWRKLHNEELHNMYSSPSITGMIKSRKMRLHLVQIQIPKLFVRKRSPTKEYSLNYKNERRPLIPCSSLSLL
jgi:hypothetical protein